MNRLHIAYRFERVEGVDTLVVGMISSKLEAIQTFIKERSFVGMGGWSKYVKWDIKEVDDGEMYPI